MESELQSLSIVIEGGRKEAREGNLQVSVSLVDEQILKHEQERSQGVHVPQNELLHDAKEVYFSKAKTTAQLIRVDAGTSQEELHNLIDQTVFGKWKLNKPNLIISVIGGTQEFQMSKHMTRSFRQNIIRTAQSSNAWVITRGTNSGVMRHIGNALRDYSVPVPDGEQSGMVCIGVTKLQTVVNHEALQAAAPAVEYEKVKKGAYLNPFHSHFVLVDDDSQLYDNEIAFRIRFQRKLADEAAPNIPICNVVMEGGMTSLNTLVLAVKQKIPTILVKNSGGVADLLATAYTDSTEFTKNRVVNGKNEVYRSTYMTDQLRSKLRKILEQTALKSNANDCLKKIEKCLEHRDLITVCRLDQQNVTKDLMSAILHALYKVSSTEEAIRGVLKLSLLWNRVEMAEKYVFSHDKSWPNEFFDDCAHDAITNDRPDFLKLLLRQHLKLKSFLSIHRLTRLYNEAPESSLLKSLLKQLVFGEESSSCVPCGSLEPESRAISLRHIGELMKLLFDDGEGHPYCDEQERYHWIDADLLFSHASKAASCNGNDVHDSAKPSRKNSSTETQLDLHKRYMEVLGVGKCRHLTIPAAPNVDDGLNANRPRVVRHFDDPAFDLFLYCILLCRGELAAVLFEWVSEPIAAGLTAKAVLKAMAANSRSIDEMKSFQAFENKFESQACEVLNSCLHSNAEDTHILLVREISAMSGRTCLDISRSAFAKMFVSESAVQSYLARLWYGRIAGYNSLMRTLTVIISAFFPPLLLALTYDEDAFKPPASVLSRSKKKAASADNPKNTCCNSRIVTKVACFYDAPVAKFTYGVITYSVFLLVLSFDLLINYNTSIKAHNGIESNPCEIFLIIYVGSYAIEEVLQAVKSSKSSLKHSLKLYFNSLWNALDWLAILFFFGAMILGNVPASADQLRTVRDAGRLLYVVSLMAYFMKMFQWLLAAESFGQKVQSAGRMLIELVNIWPVFLVFIISWGIAQWALLFPRTEPQWSLIRNVIQLSFWDMFGNTYLNIIQQQPFDVGPCTNNPALYLNYTLPQCPDPTGQIVVPILLGIYMVVVNILLINLLVALFNNAINNQEVTKEIWAFQYFELILEYRNKSKILPPFTLLYYLISLFWLATSKLHKESGSNTAVPLKATISSQSDAVLKVWMCEMRDECLKNREIQAMREPQSQIEKLLDKQRHVKRAVRNTMFGMKENGLLRESPFTPMTP